MFEKNNTTFEISEKEFTDILTNYFSDKTGKNIKIEKVLSIKYKAINDESLISVPNVDFYITEEDDNYHLTSLLSQRDIEEALTNYACSLGYDFASYKYIGGINHVGYFIDEDTPYLMGISINLKERTMKRELK